MVRSASRSRSRHRCAGTARRTDSGTSPTSSALTTRACAATTSYAAAGPNASGSTRLHDTCTPDGRSKASERTAGPRNARAMAFASLDGRVDPEVVGDEHRASADGHRSRRRVGEAGHGRPEVGDELAERVLAHRGQRALGPVEEAREVEGHRRPAGELVPGPHGVRHRIVGERHERHDVDDPEPGMGARVGRAGRGGPPPRRPPPSERPRRRGSARDRLWSGSLWTSSRSGPATEAIAATSDWSRPSLMLTTHSSTVCGHRDLPPEASLPGPTCTLGAVVRPIWQKSGTRSGRPSLR